MDESYEVNVILFEDELARMILSMNRYHTGARGGERQIYLSAWSGGSALTETAFVV